MGQPQNREDQEPGEVQEESVVESEAQPKTYFVGGRERTADELAQSYAASTEENEKLRARLEALEQRSQTPPPIPKAPPWASGLVAAGVPEEVVGEMVGWMEQQADSRADVRAAARVEELVSGLSTMASKDSESDAALMADPQMSGYTPEGLKALLAANSAFKQRYDRIFAVDPEGAKRLAWVTLRGEAKPRQGANLTTPPRTRRVSANQESEAKVLEALRKSAREGAPADVAKFMAERLKHHNQTQE